MISRSAAIAVVAAAFMMSAIPARASILYAVDESIGGGSVVGSITTDGTIGTLTAANFISWSLTFNGLLGATFNTDETSSVVIVQGADVTASLTNIYFNYDGADNGYLLIQHNPFSGQTYWCNATIYDTCFQGASIVPVAYNDPSTQIAGRQGNNVIASASTQVPEPSAAALLSIMAAGIFGSCWRTTRRQVRT